MITIKSSGGGGISIGGAITGGTPNRVLYIDGSGNLAQDDGLQYDGTNLTLDENLILTAGKSIIWGSTNWSFGYDNIDSRFEWVADAGQVMDLSATDLNIDVTTRIDSNPGNPIPVLLVKNSSSGNTGLSVHNAGANGVNFYYTGNLGSTGTGATVNFYRAEDSGGDSETPGNLAGVRTAESQYVFIYTGGAYAQRLTRYTQAGPTATDSRYVLSFTDGVTDGYEFNPVGLSLNSGTVAEYSLDVFNTSDIVARFLKNSTVTQTGTHVAADYLMVSLTDYYSDSD